MAEFWKESSRSVGTIKVGKTVKIVFYPLEIIPPIQSIKASCGCTTIGKITDGKLEVVYTAQAVPKHLRNHGVKEYNINKHVTVRYEDGRLDLLRITGIVQQ